MMPKSFSANNTLNIRLRPDAEPVTISIQLDESGRLSVSWPENRTEKNTQAWVLSHPTQGRVVHEALLQIGQTVLPVYAVNTSTHIWVWVGGQITCFEKILQTTSRRSAQLGDAGGVSSGDIKAPMPGKILQIKAQVGEALEKNQPVMMMESMKMEMTLAAPCDGVLSELLCEEGQMVEMGAVLARLTLSVETL